MFNVVRTQFCTMLPCLSRSFASLKPSYFKLKYLWAENNEEMRKNHLKHQNGLYAPHIQNSRALMDKITKDFSGYERTVVCGPGLLEPLSSLVDRTALILIDEDIRTLETVSEGLPANRVRLLEFDLSHGLFNLVDGLLDFDLEEGTYWKDGLNLILDKLAKFTPANDQLPEKYTGVDLVISSLVASQLASQIEKLILGTFWLRGNVDIGVKLAEDKDLLKKYNQVFLDLRARLAAKHFEDLGAIAGRNASIYFSDTIACNLYPGRTSIPNNALKLLTERFTLVEKREWKWQYNPEIKKVYTVQAYHLKNSTPN